MKSSFGDGTAVLRCGRCGRFAEWWESALQVVCGCRPHLELPPVLVRDASADERDKAVALLQRHFGAAFAAHGNGDVLERASMLVAEGDREVAGALAWHLADGALQILAVATDPMWQRTGIGGHLLAEAELIARRHEQPQIVATITNDNLPALYFYQRRGYRILRIDRDVFAAEPPRTGFGNIPIVDEIRLVKAL